MDVERPDAWVQRVSRYSRLTALHTLTLSCSGESYVMGDEGAAGALGH
jgi:hypothetical protein